jgi:hypothetical protein
MSPAVTHTRHLRGAFCANARTYTMHIDRSQLPDPPPSAQRKEMAKRFRQMTSSSSTTPDVRRMCVEAILEGDMIFNYERDMLQLTKQGYDKEFEISRRLN